MVWDRCNYSDNIREPALPAVLSPRLVNVMLGLGNAATLYVLHFLFLSFSLHTFVYSHFLPSLFFSLLSNLFSAPTWTHSFFSLLQQHMFIYSPLFSVVCKAEFVPVGWKSNEGKSRCYCAAVDCAPHPTLFIDCEPQTRQMLSLYASSVSYIHLPSRNAWLLQYLFDCSEWVPPVCSARCPWSQCIHPKCPCLKHPIAAMLSVKLKNVHLLQKGSQQI